MQRHDVDVYGKPANLDPWTQDTSIHLLSEKGHEPWELVGITAPVLGVEPNKGWVSIACCHHVCCVADATAFALVTVGSCDALREHFPRLEDANR